MQRYINQITGDIKAAQMNLPPDPDLGNEENYEEFEEKMLAIENTPDVPAKQLLRSLWVVTARNKAVPYNLQSGLNKVFSFMLFFSAG